MSKEKFKITYSKEAKEDIAEVERYLEEQGSFVDKLMVNIVHNQNNFVINEIGNIAYKMGVAVDETRLKNWLRMCQRLDNLDYKIITDIALKNKFISMKNQIEDLKYQVEYWRNKYEQEKDINHELRWNDERH